MPRNSKKGAGSNIIRKMVMIAFSAPSLAVGVVHDKEVKSHVGSSVIRCEARRSDYTALDNPKPLQCCWVSTDMHSERFPHCWYHHASPNAETPNIDKHEPQGAQHNTTHAALNTRSIGWRRHSTRWTQMMQTAIPIASDTHMVCKTQARESHYSQFH